MKSQIQGGIYSVKLSFCGWLTLFSNGVCTSDHQRVTRVRPAQGLFRGEGEAMLKIVKNSGGVKNRNYVFTCLKEIDLVFLRSHFNF